MWIEIGEGGKKKVSNLSLPAWGVWIEIVFQWLWECRTTSLPAWGVWIEIAGDKLKLSFVDVAPRMGSVD